MEKISNNQKKSYPNYSCLQAAAGFFCYRIYRQRTDNYPWRNRSYSENCQKKKRESVAANISPETSLKFNQGVINWTVIVVYGNIQPVVEEKQDSDVDKSEGDEKKTGNQQRVSRKSLDDKSVIQNFL